MSSATKTKSFLLCTAAGPVLVLTQYDFIKHPNLLCRLSERGFDKFTAWEVPLDTVKARYGTAFDVVCRDPKQTDELRVLDDSGERVFKNIDFKDLSKPEYCEVAG